MSMSSVVLCRLDQQVDANADTLEDRIAEEILQQVEQSGVPLLSWVDLESGVR